MSVTPPKRTTKTTTFSSDSQADSSRPRKTRTLTPPAIHDTGIIVKNGEGGENGGGASCGVGNRRGGLSCFSLLFSAYLVPIFSILLFFGDIAMDHYTAATYLVNKDLWWGGLTFAIVAGHGLVSGVYVVGAVRRHASVYPNLWSTPRRRAATVGAAFVGFGPTILHVDTILDWWEERRRMRRNQEPRKRWEEEERAREKTEEKEIFLRKCCLLEATLESVPQAILQSYILIVEILKPPTVCLPLTFGNIGDPQIDPRCKNDVRDHSQQMLLNKFSNLWHEEEGNFTEHCLKEMPSIGGCRITMDGKLLDDCFYVWSNIYLDYYVSTLEGYIPYSGSRAHPNILPMIPLVTSILSASMSFLMNCNARGASSHIRKVLKRDKPGNLYWFVFQLLDFFNLLFGFCKIFIYSGMIQYLSQNSPWHIWTTVFLVPGLIIRVALPESMWNLKRLKSFLFRLGPGKNQTRTNHVIRGFQFLLVVFSTLHMVFPFLYVPPATCEKWMEHYVVQYKKFHAGQPGEDNYCQFTEPLPYFFTENFCRLRTCGRRNNSAFALPWPLHRQMFAVLDSAVFARDRVFLKPSVDICLMLDSKRNARPKWNCRGAFPRTPSWISPSLYDIFNCTEYADDCAGIGRRMGMGKRKVDFQPYRFITDNVYSISVDYNYKFFHNVLFLGTLINFLDLIAYCTFNGFWLITLFVLEMKQC